MLKSLLMAVALVLTTQAHANTANSFLNEAVAIQPATINVTGTYFDQFVYQTEGDCKKIDSVWFHSTHAWEPAMLGNDPKGRPDIASLSIQLFPNGTYYAEYEELAITKVAPPYTDYENLFSKKLTGTWTVSGNQLLVQGLGVGMPSKMTLPSGTIADSISFKMTTALNDQRVLTNLMNIGKSTTNNGPNGISINQYCGVK